VDLMGDRGRTRVVALGDLRIAAGLLLAGAAVQPFLPGPGGLPCPLREITGVPCPLCGMTTSVVASVHGRFGDALAANPAGVLAVALAVVLVLWSRPRVAVIPTWAPLVALAAMWMFQLHRFSVI
jgi:Protein of unknown function (DUF2752)